MSVTINSGVNATASHESSLTDPPLVLNTSTGTFGAGSFQISDVIGLQAELDSKLNDTIGPVGPANVFANGSDINLLAGLNAYGLTQADLQKIADTNASSTELNYLVGVTGLIQTQIDAAFDADDFSAADEMIVSTGAATASVESIADVLSGTVGVGYEFNNLKPATASLDFNNQKAINVLDPTNPQDAATKAYVDSAVLGGGTFLPLAGGVMTGNIDLDGNSIVLDADGDTTIGASVDDTVVLDVAGTAFTWTTTGFDMGGVAITNLADPTAAQEAATRNYVDTTFLPLAGGTMTGGLDMDGWNLILDADGDTFFNEAADDVIELVLGTGVTISFGTNINTGGLDIAGLPAVPVGATSAVSLAYADATYATLSGATLTGDLDLGGNVLLNPADPTLGTHVGDRDYNDARYFQVANNLSEGTATTMRSNLGLATVAATGDYNDLINLPTIVSSLNDLTDVVVGTPGAPQDGYLLTWNNGAGNFDLQPASVISVFGRTGVITATSGDYTAAQITNVAAGNIVATDVQAAINELDTEKLARDGSQAMTGNLAMGSNQITGMAPPFTFGDHDFQAAQYQSGLGGTGFLIRTTNAATAGTPTYSFVGAPDTGMWLSGAAIAVSVGGTNSLVVSGSTVSAEGNRVTNVGSPTSSGDAVNLSYLNGLGVQRVLGSVSGVDLLGSPGGTVVNIYTLPAGVMHMITKIVVVATSYAPGVSPSAPIVSIGTLGANYDQIVASATLDWEPGGAADQAVYVDPDQGAETPNAAATVSVQIDTPAAGTFSALEATVYVLGIEL